MGGRNGTTTNKTRTVMGGMERITYEEQVNGVTVIRTRWKKKKTREKTRTTKRNFAQFIIGNLWRIAQENSLRLQA